MFSSECHAKQLSHVQIFSLFHLGVSNQNDVATKQGEAQRKAELAIM